MVGLIGLSACVPTRTYEEVVHRMALPRFTAWWEQEQAQRHQVDVATVRRWLRHDPRRLDDRAARRGHFDVSTDLCSFAPDTGATFDFRLPCVRHDVAWRNLRRGLGPNTRIERRRANARFEADARATCGARPWAHRAGCWGVARLYRLALDVVS